MNFPNLNILIQTLLLFFVMQSYSQNSTNSASTVIYKLKIIDDLRNQDLENSTKTKITAINKASELIECKLHFNNRKSVFYQIKKMPLDNDLNYRLASVFTKGIYYTDLEDSIKILNKNFSDKNFNIIVPQDKYKWQITNETKQIGDYLCIKAITSISDVSITAWFTTEIPVPFGPKGIDGLPGLILETVINNKSIFYATNIKLEDNDIKNFNKPKAEITISETEFLELASKKMADYFND